MSISKQATGPQGVKRLGTAYYAVRKDHPHGSPRRIVRRKAKWYEPVAGASFHDTRAYLIPILRVNESRAAQSGNGRRP